MNPYELIMMIQQKMNQNPTFAARFNELTNELNNVPGLQQEVIKIIQITDPKKRQRAIDRLPSSVKKTVKEMFALLNS